MALQQEYFAIPPITRAYTTTCLLTTLAVVSADKGNRMRRVFSFAATRIRHGLSIVFQSGIDFQTISSNKLRTSTFILFSSNDLFVVMAIDHLFLFLRWYWF